MDTVKEDVNTGVTEYNNFIITISVFLFLLVVLSISMKITGTFHTVQYIISGLLLVSFIITITFLVAFLTLE